MVTKGISTLDSRQRKVDMHTQRIRQLLKAKIFEKLSPNTDFSLLFNHEAYSKEEIQENRKLLEMFKKQVQLKESVKERFIQQQ